ncbi:MAG: ester cyclase [Chloroflexota bacterium]
MGTEENKAIVRRMLEEGWNPGNLAVFDELLADDFENHDPGAPTVHTREDVKNYWAAHCAAFPDHHTTIEALIADGDCVVKQWSDSGTFTGEFMGIPPNGKKVTGTGLTLYRIENGKIKELRWGYDSFSLLQQLGAIPQLQHA